MQIEVGDLQHIRASGRMACFTRPEFRTERLSNVVGSSDAWSGLLSQIQGHPGTRYQIESVALLFQPRWVNHTANEISDFGTGRGPINTEDVRTLRTTSYIAGNRRTIRRNILGDLIESEVAGVDYLVSFRLAAPRQRFKDFKDMLNRRLRNGHYWRQPYLGLRELTAMVEPVKDFGDLEYPSNTQLVEHPNGLKTADYSAQLGLCFFGIDWDDPTHPYYFAPLEVKRGIVQYPTWAEVRRLGIRREGYRC